MIVLCVSTKDTFTLTECATKSPKLISLIIDKRHQEDITTCKMITLDSHLDKRRKRTNCQNLLEVIMKPADDIKQGNKLLCR